MNSELKLVSYLKDEANTAIQVVKGGEMDIC